MRVLVLIAAAAGCLGLLLTVASGAKPRAPSANPQTKTTDPAAKPDVPPSKPGPAPAPAGEAAPTRPAATPVEAAPVPPAEPAESIEADVSTRTVAVTSAFRGTEIVLFGSVTNSRQASAEAGYYDIVAVVEGRGPPAVVRLKDRVGGLWINTEAVRFDGLPLYSAIASSRPVEEIAEPATLVANGIGFPRARMIPGKGAGGMPNDKIDAFKSAFLRLKQKDGLYVRADYGVAFIGRALFRASVKLPANIPVGPLTARVFLFHDGQLLSIHTAGVVLRRTGVERLIYDFAYEHPASYGLLAVALATLAGLAASAAFRQPMA